MRITVDRSKCIALGVCESLAPQNFAVADDGALVITVSSVGPESAESVEQAVMQCPTSALKLTP